MIVVAAAGKRKLSSVPLEMLLAFNVVSEVPLPLKVVAVTVPEKVAPALVTPIRSATPLSTRDHLVPAGSTS